MQTILRNKLLIRLACGLFVAAVLLTVAVVMWWYTNDFGAVCGRVWAIGLAFAAQGFAWKLGKYNPLDWVTYGFIGYFAGVVIWPMIQSEGAEGAMLGAVFAAIHLCSHGGPKYLETLLFSQRVEEAQKT